MRASTRVARNDRQLDLFTFDALRFPPAETAAHVRPDLLPTSTKARSPAGGEPSRLAVTEADAGLAASPSSRWEGLHLPPFELVGEEPAAVDAPQDRFAHPASPEDEEWVEFQPIGEASAEPATVPPPEPLRNQNNYRITDEDRLGTGSLKRKCHDNLAAIGLLKRLETVGRLPTPDEQRLFVRYVGWGGLPQVFDAWNEEWAAQRQQLERLLTPAELDSARATTLNAHYTPPVVIRAVYAALQRFGFEHGRILEPTCGLGHFFGLMPDAMRDHSVVTGIEIDSVTARLAKALYPDVDLRHQPFEYAERLAFLSGRQQEIEEALDLTKNQAPSQLAAAPEDEEGREA